MGVREGEAIATRVGHRAGAAGADRFGDGVANEQADIRNGGGIDGFDAWSAAAIAAMSEPRAERRTSRRR